MASAPQLLAAAWLLRALSERCTLRFAGRLALAQGLRFLRPTGACSKLDMCRVLDRECRDPVRLSSLLL